MAFIEKIACKIGIEYINIHENKQVVAFDILYPTIYESKLVANDFRHKKKHRAFLCKEKETVYIKLYEDEKLVDTIGYNEKRKYNCYKLKKSFEDNCLIKNEDFEPCLDSFELIFEELTKKDSKLEKIELNSIAFWITNIKNN